MVYIMIQGLVEELNLNFDLDHSKKKLTITNMIDKSTIVFDKETIEYLIKDFQDYRDGMNYNGDIVGNTKNIDI